MSCQKVERRGGKRDCEAGWQVLTRLDRGRDAGPREEAPSQPTKRLNRSWLSSVCFCRNMFACELKGNEISGGELGHVHPRADETESRLLSRRACTAVGRRRDEDHRPLERRRRCQGEPGPVPRWDIIPVPPLITLERLQYRSVASSFPLSR